ncbi:MAG: GapS4a family protein [Flavobacterium sp.]
MGEWSKQIGEKGEKIMSFLFKEIMGYSTILENPPLECIKGDKHQSKTAKKERSTHGIDGLISYKSPLEDKVLDIIVASSKFTSKEYPSTPKTKFKEYLEDIAHTIECFKYSKLISDTKKQYSNISRTDICGIIVWPSNASPLDYELIPHISNSIIDPTLNFDRVILVDNDRFNFLFETIYNSRKTYGFDKVNVIYHNTGLNNISQQSLSYGKILPIQYLVSDIIPLRIEKDRGDIEITIYCKNNFNAENLSQTLSFAKTFDHLDSVSKTNILFSDYDSLEHIKIVQEQLVKFDKYVLQTNLEITKYPNDFRNN